MINDIKKITEELKFLLNEEKSDFAKYAEHFDDLKYVDVINYANDKKDRKFIDILVNDGSAYDNMSDKQWKEYAKKLDSTEYYKKGNGYIIRTDSDPMGATITIVLDDKDIFPEIDKEVEELAKRIHDEMNEIVG